MGIERDVVVRTALAILDEAGIEGLTMRRLAEALKIQAPSLYWHFPNKQALVDAMADAIFGEVELAPRGKRSWPKHFRAIVHAVRRALLAHRDGARVFAGTYVVTDNVLRVAEAMMATLHEAGAGPSLAADGTFSVLDYVLGFTIEEQSLGEDEGIVDLAARKEQLDRLASAKYPHVFAAMKHIVHPDFDARFAAGLDLFIAGLQVQLDRAS